MHWRRERAQIAIKACTASNRVNSRHEALAERGGLLGGQGGSGRSGGVGNWVGQGGRRRGIG